MSVLNQLEFHTTYSSEKTKSWKNWIPFFVLAFLFHIILILIRLEWLTPENAVPPPVEVQKVDPKKLEAIRKQWKEKSLLIDKTPSEKKSEEAPADAKYESDRNIRVEKEQRAKNTQVVPKPGQPQPQTKSQKKQAQKSRQKESAKAQPKKIPNLKSLGLPLQFKEAEKKVSQRETEETVQKQNPSVQQGGEQAILDKDIAVGSENLLNAQESVYYSFFARLYEEIGPIWQSRIREIPYRNKLTQGEYTTVVDVVFDHAGNLIDVKLIHSSGVQDFDNAVDESWRKIGRFPNPPSGLLDKQNQVHTGWTFVLQVAEGFGLRSLPPERNY